MALRRIAVRPLAQLVLLAWGLGGYAAHAYAAHAVGAEGTAEGSVVAEAGGVGRVPAPSPAEPDARAGQTHAAAAPAKRPAAAMPEVIEFNPDFFNGDVADIQRFTRGNPLPAGIYTVALSVNGSGKGQHDIRFEAAPGSDVATPCFTLAALDRFGVNIEAVRRRLAGAADDAGGPRMDGAASATGAEQANACRPIGRLIPEGSVSYDAADLALELTVPQIDMKYQPSGYVDPALWDAGIDAGLLQYNFSTYTAHQRGTDNQSAYLGLQLGVNLGQWRFRERGALNWQSHDGRAHWENQAIYVERDLTALRSRLTLGDSFTPGDVFDSFTVRGVQISSDDRMLPDSLRYYAPVVRGMAESNARVVVRQNSNIIYETSVPPGPFELADLPATGYGGDLQVTVEEADGRKQFFAVPFASVPQLLRPGSSRFHAAAGWYRDGMLRHDPWVAQLTYQRGLTNLFTGYAGIAASQGYGAGLLGLALNTPLGAFGFDVTTARTELPDRTTSSGASWRLSYSKLVPGMNTNVALAAYRYSTEGFYSLRDALYARNAEDATLNPGGYRARSRLQLNINQPLGRLGAVYVSGSAQDYWGGGRGRDMQFQAGLTGAVGRVSYTVYGQRSYDQHGKAVTQGGVNLSIPLGNDSSVNRGPFDVLTANAARSTNGDSTIQANLTGSAAGNTVSYGLSALRMAHDTGQTTSIGGYGVYRSQYGTYSANASIGNNVRQASVNANGAILAHAGGVTLSPPFGSAGALIEAKGAKGAEVINGQGARIDSNGYAVVSTLMPYRMNRVGLDPSDLSDDVELLNTSEDVVPRANAFVLVKMPTVSGTPSIVTVEDGNGKPLPLGSRLFDGGGKAVGDIGQGGVAFLRGLEGKGTLVARWGPDPDAQCELPYAIPERKPAGAAGAAAGIARLSLRCEPPLRQ